MSTPKCPLESNLTPILSDQDIQVSRAESEPSPASLKPYAEFEDPNLRYIDPFVFEAHQRSLLAMVVLTQYKLAEDTRHGAPSARTLKTSVPKIFRDAFRDCAETLLRNLNIDKEARKRANIKLGRKFECDGFMKFVPIDLAELLESPPDLTTSETLYADVALMEASRSAHTMIIKLLQLIRAAMACDFHYRTHYMAEWAKMLGVKFDHTKIKCSSRKKRAVTIAMLSLSYVGQDGGKSLEQLTKIKTSSFLRPWFEVMGEGLMVVNAGYQLVYPSPKSGDRPTNIFAHSAMGLRNIVGEAIKERETRQLLQEEIRILKADHQALRAENQALRADIQALRADNQALRADNQALKADYQALKADYQALKADHEALKALITNQRQS